MSLPKYPHYKPSGVEWLGDVPAHWVVSPIKSFGKIKGGSGFPHESQGVEDEELNFFKVGSLGNADAYGRLQFSENTISRQTAARLGAFIFPSRTVVFAKVGAAIFLGRIREIAHEACIDNNMMGVMLNDENHVVFVRYAMSLVCFDLIANPGAVPSLNEGQVGKFVLCKPPLHEQSTIAHFLDHETAKIDALIAEQAKLIALLAEKRQATISHAVTRGLDPAAPMKDSGVAWLGEVPAHWEVLTFQRCVYVQEGQVDPEKEPFCSMILIAPNHVESGSGKIVSIETAQEQAAESGKYLCKSGDVIYSKIRPALRKVCIAPEDCLCSADMYPLRGLAGLSNTFLMWFMLSESFSALAVLESERVAMPKINRDSLKAVLVPVPDLSEQMEIVEFLAKETTRLDALRAEAERAIALLKERRAALIAAAVTGQIDVRQAVAA